MSTIALHPTYVAPRVAPRARTQVRLTRRGRLAVFLACLGVLLTLAFLYGGQSVATNESEPTRVITVDGGDTLWAIAAELADDGQVRAMMHRIERLNGLESGMLMAGQQLLVPVD